MVSSLYGKVGSPEFGLLMSLGNESLVTGRNVSRVGDYEQSKAVGLPAQPTHYRGDSSAPGQGDGKQDNNEQRRERVHAW